MSEKEPSRDKDSGCRKGGSYRVENPDKPEPKRKEKEKKKE